jgi:hypothetical protein
MTMLLAQAITTKEILYSELRKVWKYDGVQDTQKIRNLPEEVPRSQVCLLTPGALKRGQRMLAKKQD